jgi:predicted Fe-S protein YdhL (DUF1289 family)
MTSPCVKVCQMDPVRGVCIGCCRTLDEIARWGGMSDQEQFQVLEQLPERRRRLDVPEIAVPPLA